MDDKPIIYAVQRICTKEPKLVPISPKALVGLITGFAKKYVKKNRKSNKILTDFIDYVSRESCVGGLKIENLD